MFRIFRTIGFVGGAAAPPRPPAFPADRAARAINSNPSPQSPRHGAAIWQPGNLEHPVALSPARHKYDDVFPAVRGEPVERSTELVAGHERSPFDQLRSEEHTSELQSPL